MAACTGDAVPPNAGDPLPVSNAADVCSPVPMPEPGRPAARDDASAGGAEGRGAAVAAVSAGSDAPAPARSVSPARLAAHPAMLEESIAAKRAFLLRHGVALWDVIESCDIKGSSDASIRNVVPARIERVMGAAPITAVVCNGAAAGRLYARYLRERTGLEARVLPSTSPANASWSLERLCERWRACWDELRAEGVIGVVRGSDA